MTTSPSNKPVIREDYKTTDQWKALIEESQAIVTETKFNAHMVMVEGKHQLGERIASDPLYRKYGKGNQDFLDEVAKEVGIGKTELYYCVRFYLKFPKFAQAVQTLPADQKTLTWHRVKMLLPAEDGCKHSKTEKETLLITRKRCVSCGKVTEETKEKKS